MYDPNNRLKQRVCPLRAIATTDLIEIADPENEHDAIRAFSSGQAPAVYRMLDREALRCADKGQIEAEM
jgi:hypothetical protein